MRLYIGPVGSDGSVHDAVSGQNGEIDVDQIRCLDISDISEVRPGKFSFEMDGGDNKPRITIVGSEQRICLPMPTKALRDKLLGRFQKFLEVWQSNL